MLAYYLREPHLPTLIPLPSIPQFFGARRGASNATAAQPSPANLLFVSKELISPASSHTLTDSSTQLPQHLRQLLLAPCQEATPLAVPLAQSGTPARAVPTNNGDGQQEE